MKHHWYRWIIVAVGFLVLGISWSATQSGFGTLVSPMTQGMGWSRTAVATAFSIHIAVTFISGVFWGWLVDRWTVRWVIAASGLMMGLGLFLSGFANSLWQLYLFYGLISGIGLGGTASPLTAIVVRWFPCGQGLAIGTVYAGVGGVSSVLPIVVERLVGLYGWQSAFQGLSFLVWIGFLLGTILLKEPHLSVGISTTTSETPADNPLPDSHIPTVIVTEDCDLKDALRMRGFWIIFGMVVAANLVLNMILVHLVARAIDSGVSSATAVTLFTVSGIVTMVSTLCGGALGDRFGHRRMYIGALALLTVALIWLAASNVLWMFYVFAIAFGLGNGGWFPQIPVIAGRIFGTRHIGSIFAALLLGAGIGSVVGPVTAGYVFDITQSYRIAFIFGAVVAFIGVFLAIVLKKPTYYRGRGK